jgi:CubicO group peptidase (beta-lactamase class C family)
MQASRESVDGKHYGTTRGGFTLTSATDKANSKWNAFEEYVEQVMKENHIAGAAVAVSSGGDVVYAKGFGVRDITKDDPVTPESIFGVASVSKSFTALAVSQLVDRGLVSLDDPVTKYIPEFRLHGADMSRVTVRHILSHSTGLPPMTRREDIIRLQDHVEFLNGETYELLGKPGEYFSYANDTFLLNGLIIERLTGQLYRRYMTYHVLDAIGMNRTTYNLEELPKMGNVTVPYDFDLKKGVLERKDWPTLGTYEVGGGVRSNVLDLMKYAQVYLNKGVAANGRRLISEDSVKAMCTPVVSTGRRSFYCLALQTTPGYHGVTIMEHGGGQPGVSSNFGFVPEKGIAAAVLTNVGGVPAGAIWLSAVNVALGLPMDEKRSVETEWIDVPKGYLHRFAGTYQCNEGGKFTITVEGRSAKIENVGQEFELKIADETTAFYESMGQQMVVRFFFKDGSQKPWAALAGSRMLRRSS